MNTRKPETLPEIDLNIPGMLSRLGGDRELLADLVSIYCDDYPVLLEGIEEAARQRNARQLQMNSHALKGLISNFLHDATTGLALKLEKMGKNNEWDQIDHAVSQMRIAASNLKDVLTVRVLPELK